jgi:chromosome segregation ATPase
MRNKTMTGAMLASGALLLGTMLLGPPAAAQEMVARSPSAVAECLCAEQALDALGTELRSERVRYDASRDRLGRLEARVRSLRGNVNVEVRAEIESFKALVERRDAARDAFNAESERYNRAVARYNEAVSHNNAACTGRLFDPAEVAAIRATLECRRP